MLSPGSPSSRLVLAGFSWFLWFSHWFLACSFLAFSLLPAGLAASCWFSLASPLLGFSVLFASRPQHRAFLLLGLCPTFFLLAALPCSRLVCLLLVGSRCFIVPACCTGFSPSLTVCICLLPRLGLQWGISNANCFLLTPPTSQSLFTRSSVDTNLRGRQIYRMVGRPNL